MNKTKVEELKPILSNLLLVPFKDAYSANIQSSKGNSFDGNNLSNYDLSMFSKLEEQVGKIKEIYLENTSENWRQYMMYTNTPGYSVYVTTEPNNGENIIRCVNINYNDRILVGCQERNEFYDESGNII